MILSQPCLFPCPSAAARKMLADDRVDVAAKPSKSEKTTLLIISLSMVIVKERVRFFQI
jgi:hypothetical protein